MEHICQRFLVCKSVARVGDFMQLHAYPSLRTEVVKGERSQLQALKFLCIFLAFFLFCSRQGTWALRPYQLVFQSLLLCS